ncbi:hypothetical protein JB92DRAFT_3148159, partial [Gautieria morchelliformis]
MPLPRIQDPSNEDEVQLLPIKSARSGRTLKPSAALKDPIMWPMFLTIVEPALVIEPNARTVAKPTDFSSTEMVMNKESGGITGTQSKATPETSAIQDKIVQGAPAGPDGWLKDLDAVEGLPDTEIKSKDRTLDTRYFFDNLHVEEGKKIIDCKLCRKNDRQKITYVFEVSTLRR